MTPKLHGLLLKMGVTSTTKNIRSSIDSVTATDLAGWAFARYERDFPSIELKFTQGLPLVAKKTHRQDVLNHYGKLAALSPDCGFEFTYELPHGEHPYELTATTQNGVTISFASGVIRVSEAESLRTEAIRTECGAVCGKAWLTPDEPLTEIRLHAGGRNWSLKHGVLGEFRIPYELPHGEHQYELTATTQSGTTLPLANGVIRVSEAEVLRTEGIRTEGGAACGKAWLAPDEPLAKIHLHAGGREWSISHGVLGEFRIPYELPHGEHPYELTATSQTGTTLPLAIGVIRVFEAEVLRTEGIWTENGAVCGKAWLAPDEPLAEIHLNAGGREWSISHGLLGEFRIPYELPHGEHPYELTATSQSGTTLPLENGVIRVSEAEVLRTEGIRTEGGAVCGKVWLAPDEPLAEIRLRAGGREWSINHRVLGEFRIPYELPHGEHPYELIGITRSRTMLSLLHGDIAINPRDVIRFHIDFIDQCTIQGWAFALAWHRIDTIHAKYKEHASFAKMGMPRQDVASHFQYPSAAQCGFCIHLDLPQGDNEVQIVATLDTGVAIELSKIIIPIDIEDILRGEAIQEKINNDPIIKVNQRPPAPSDCKKSGSNDAQSLSAVLFSHSPHLGGAERSLLDLIRGLIAKNVKCTVVTPGNGPLLDLIEKAGATVISMPENSAPAWWWVSDEGGVSGILFRKTFVSVIKYLIPKLRLIQPDVIISQTIVSPWGMVCAEILKAQHAFCPREYGEMDHSLFFKFPQSMSAAYATSDRIFCISNDVRNTLFAQDDNHKTRINYSSISVPDEKRTRNNDDIKVAILGSIHEGKGQLDFIRGISELSKNIPNIKGLLLGGISDEKYALAIQSEILKQNCAPFIEQISFIDNPYPLMAQMDAIISCARQEALGRTLIEAALLKTPIIYSDVGGPHEVFQNGIHGLSYPAGDHIALTNAIRETLEDRKSTGRRVESAFNYCKDKFTDENYSGKVYSEMRACLQSSPARGNACPVLNLLMLSPGGILFEIESSPNPKIDFQISWNSTEDSFSEFKSPPVPFKETGIPQSFSWVIPAGAHTTKIEFLNHCAIIRIISLSILDSKNNVISELKSETLLHSIQLESIGLISLFNEEILITSIEEDCKASIRHPSINHAAARKIILTTCVERKRYPFMQAGDKVTLQL